MQILFSITGCKLSTLTLIENMTFSIMHSKYLHKDINNVRKSSLANAQSQTPQNAEPKEKAHGTTPFNIEISFRETSDTHIVDALELFWNMTRAPPSTKAAASFDRGVAPCRFEKDS